MQSEKSKTVRTYAALRSDISEALFHKCQVCQHYKQLPSIYIMWRFQGFVEYTLV